MSSHTTGAGTGKSSISAALTLQLLGRQDPKDGSWLGTASAVHFVKLSDQRRLEPARIIKSLAYQLAVRWVQVWDGWAMFPCICIIDLTRPLTYSVVYAGFPRLLLPC